MATAPKAKVAPAWEKTAGDPVAKPDEVSKEAGAPVAKETAESQEAPVVQPEPAVVDSFEKNVDQALDQLRSATAKGRGASPAVQAELDQLLISGHAFYSLMKRMSPAARDILTPKDE